MSGSGHKVNGSNGKEKGSSFVANGPIKRHVAQPQDTVSQVNESDLESTEKIEEGKNLQGARSTDLIFLKSVVQTNTLERPKKVGKTLELTNLIRSIV